MAAARARAPAKPRAAAPSKRTAGTGAPMPAAHADLPFDPKTGDWRVVAAASGRAAPATPGTPSPPAAAATPVDPAAPRRGWLATALKVLLILDLVAAGFIVVGNVYAGAVQWFAPDSAAAQEIRRQMEQVSVGGVVSNSLLSLLIFGLVPLVWLLGTRQRPIQGTLDYLRMRGTWRDLVRGVLLTIPVLVSVVVLILAYVLVTDGPDGLSEEQSNPGVDAMLEIMTIPLALLVSFCAAFGEELFFRGILQKRIGIWGQAALFGAAHAAGAYLPQVLFAFALGVLFGYLLKRGWPLWSLMVTHFLYDMTLLTLAVFGYG